MAAAAAAAPAVAAAAAGAPPEDGAGRARGRAACAPAPRPPPRATAPARSAPPPRSAPQCTSGSSSFETAVRGARAAALSTPFAAVKLSLPYACTDARELARRSTRTRDTWARQGNNAATSSGHSQRPRSIPREFFASSQTRDSRIFPRDLNSEFPYAAFPVGRGARAAPAPQAVRPSPWGSPSARRGCGRAGRPPPLSLVLRLQASPPRPGVREAVQQARDAHPDGARPAAGLARAAGQAGARGCAARRGPASRSHLTTVAPCRWRAAAARGCGGREQASAQRGRRRWWPPRPGATVSARPTARRRPPGRSRAAVRRRGRRRATGQPRAGYHRSRDGIGETRPSRAGPPGPALVRVARPDSADAHGAGRAGRGR